MVNFQGICSLLEEALLSKELRGSLMHYKSIELVEIASQIFISQVER